MLRRSLSQPVDLDVLAHFAERHQQIMLNGVKLATASEDEHDARTTSTTASEDDDDQSDDEAILSDSDASSSGRASISARVGSRRLRRLSAAAAAARKRALQELQAAAAASKRTSKETTSGSSSRAGSGEFEDVVVLAEAVFDHVSFEPEELTFRAGDLIQVLETPNRDWWWGVVTSGADTKRPNMGWFPASFVRLRIGQQDPVEDEDSCVAPAAVNDDVEAAESVGEKDQEVVKSSSENTKEESSEEARDTCSTTTISTSTTPTVSANENGVDAQQLQPSTNEMNGSRRKMSLSVLSHDQVRTSVIRELVHTERDFVRLLQDVAEGYVAECRKRADMFSDAQIETIFGNLEEILRFQEGFLRDLEERIVWEAPQQSCVGAAFLRHLDGFKAYSVYCNSHPMASAALQKLYHLHSYAKFFEACRLMRGLVELPLHGYLLAPVQRVCRYPLQLAELLKYTRPGHADREQVAEALCAMRGVATLINERKRRLEGMEKIDEWQHTRVDNWEGEDLIELSSQLIHQGEVSRITSGMWTSNTVLFLFDHQLVYCKKDILKRRTYIYKGRMNLDTCEVIDVPDGKEPQFGVNVRHAIKLVSEPNNGAAQNNVDTTTPFTEHEPGINTTTTTAATGGKNLLICCRSSAEKRRWLEAFAEERIARKRLISGVGLEDQQELAASARQLARLAAATEQLYYTGTDGRRRGGPGGGATTTAAGRRSNAAQQRKAALREKRNSGVYIGGGSSWQLSAGSSNSLGRKVGTWFTFGGSNSSSSTTTASTNNNNQ